MESKLLDLMERRIVFIDGAMGTSIHALNLPLSDYKGLENCSEILVETRPDAIQEIHASFLRAGCDAVETNSFSANRIVLAEFGLADRTHDLNRRAAEIAREVCNKFDTPDAPRFVFGSMGPGTKLPTLGQTDWDTLEDSYAEQARGLLDGGADALCIETCQDILQSKAALAGVERAFAEGRRRVPIAVMVTMETTGTMLVGTDMAAAVTALEAYPQIDVIGLNCATGPQEMSEHVRHLSRFCSRRLAVIPNAGLPQLIDGQPHYTLTPAELARWLKEFVEQDGVNIVGGCCGTTPEHLAAVIDAIGHQPPQKRSVRTEPSVSSIYQSCPIRQEGTFLTVGERTNANGSKKFRELLAAEDVDGMVQMAREQVEHGAHVIDVCTAYVGRDEVADIRRAVSRFATDVTAPLMIDSTEPAAIEAALKLTGGKCIINSINLEDGPQKMKRICGYARKYGAALVALTIDEEGMAKTAEHKLRIARRIFEFATDEFGIDPGNLIFDPLTFTICTGNEADRRFGIETLEGLRLIKENLPGVHTVLGLSNISFGLKAAARSTLNSVFLHHARQNGLDAAIVHAAGIRPLFKLDDEQRRCAEDLIFDRRRAGYDPLQAYLGLFADVKPDAEPQQEVPKPIEVRLKRRIIDGNRPGIEDDLEDALRQYRPLEIINDILLDGMKTVGDLFGAGQMQLPFVLQSAETMKAAVAYLEPHMDRIEGRGKGTVVLATVRGDVHDIGKNLVDIILTNNGYTVHNLGIKQPISAIIEAWQKEDADVISLSGLLVKSTVVMKDNLRVLNERKLNPPVILGGAALTRRYVEEDLANLYKGPVYYGKDAFVALKIVEQIVSSRAALVAPVTEVKPKPAIAVPATVITRSSVAADAPVPTPPFWGRRVIEHIPLKAIVPYINENMLLRVQWGFRRGDRDKETYDRFLNTEVRSIFRDLLARCEDEEILKPRAIYGYWPARSEGNELIVYDPDDRTRELERFEFPRKRREPYWCIADFFRSTDGDEYDVAAFSIVTVGQDVSDMARRWLADNKYKDYLFLHGLGVESAEALAEYLHKQIRMELGIAGQDARDIKKLSQQGYQGSRYSFGYPACPRLEDQLKLWPLLSPERIGVTLSEEFQLHPEQSTTALICHHPEARYFNVG